MSLDTGCVGRVGMPQKIFNPPPQFSRLDTLCPTLVACLFVSWDGSFLGFFLLLSVSLLVCYTRTNVSDVFYPLPLTDTPEPTELTTLSTQGVRYISCGETHTAALTEVNIHACT